MEEAFSEVGGETWSICASRASRRGFDVVAFEEIAQHARQVIWIKLEPKWGWSPGSCDMPLYELLCDRVEVIPRPGSWREASERV